MRIRQRVRPPSTMSRKLSLFLFFTRRPPGSPLFPYTTLFRSGDHFDNPDELSSCDFGTETGSVLEWNGIRTLTWSRSESTRLNSSHRTISYAVFCLKKKNAAGESQREIAATFTSDHQRTPAGV